MGRVLSVLSSICVFGLLGLPVLALAGSGNKALADKSLDEVAISLANPVSGLAYLGVEVDYLGYQGDLPGAGDQTGLRYIFRPAMGFKLSNGKNILFRGSIPDVQSQAKYVAGREYYDFLIRQRADTLPPDGYFETGHSFMGDIGWDLAYGGVNDNNWITMYGVAGVVGSSRDTSASRRQHLLGPEFAIGKVTDWGVAGAWATHLVNVAGSNTEIDTQLTTLRIFFAYGLGNGWQIVSNPVITYDWEAVSGNKLLLPLAGGISKTTRIGRVPLKMDLEIQNYIISPDAYGPQWLLSFSITPVFANPFHK